MIDILIKYNFFDNFNYLKDEFKKIKLYNLEDYNNETNSKENWPGLRSKNLFIENKFLTALYVNQIRKYNIIDPNVRFNVNLHVHLRLSEDDSKDWIHKDIQGGCFLSGITYLSDTNLKSGTIFYTEDEQKCSEVNALQNTSVFFNPAVNHKSGLNYGDSLENGRLTLNAFFFKI
tara:strand:- start:2584 stop:3108 length:525 start_codon:yes stop_codon:yes gene_type:complete